MSSLKIEIPFERGESGDPSLAADNVPKDWTSCQVITLAFISVLQNFCYTADRMDDQEYMNKRELFLSNYNLGDIFQLIVTHGTDEYIEKVRDSFKERLEERLKRKDESVALTVSKFKNENGFNFQATWEDDDDAVISVLVALKVIIKYMHESDRLRVFINPLLNSVLSSYESTIGAKNEND